MLLVLNCLCRCEADIHSQGYSSSETSSASSGGTMSRTMMRGAALAATARRRKAAASLAQQQLEKVLWHTHNSWMALAVHALIRLAPYCTGMNVIQQCQLWKTIVL